MEAATAPNYGYVEEVQGVVIEADQERGHRDVDALTIRDSGRDDFVVTATAAKRQYVQLHHPSPDVNAAESLIVARHCGARLFEHKR